MAKNAVVFSGRNGLDFLDLRTSVIRIPDVTLRVREAQALIDATEGNHVDLLSLISSEDDHFFRNIQYKSLTSAIVQIGLFDRYLKTQRRPDFMVGNSNGDSAMMVCSGRQTFKEMVEASQALSSNKPAQAVVPGASQIPADPRVLSLVAQPLPLLSGLNLTEYSSLEFREGAYSMVPGSSMDLRRLIGSLNQEFGIERFINIGPASAMRASDYRSLGFGDIESLDSIEMDPMLGWFWRNQRPAATAMAN